MEMKFFILLTPKGEPQRLYRRRYHKKDDFWGLEYLSHCNSWKGSMERNYDEFVKSRLKPITKEKAIQIFKQTEAQLELCY